MSPNDHFASFLKGLGQTRRLLARQEGFNTSQSLPATELEQVTELAFLQIFIRFEQELSELLVTNMLMERNAAGRVRSLLVPRSRAQALRILVGTNRYFSVMPIEQLQKVAGVYLKEGGPFANISQASKNEISKAYAVRNHIAHRSSDSAKNFRKKVTSQAAMPRNSSVAGYYLRCFQTQNTSYFDHHVSELGRALRDLCNMSA